mgnify:CR=1 FL=1
MCLTAKYFKTLLEYHINVERADDLEGRYSFVRWHNNFRIFRFPGYEGGSKKLVFDKNPAVQTRLETTRLFGDINDASFFDLKERFNFSLTMAYRPPFLTDVSLFANFYSGEDYCNMHFYRRITIFRIGIQAFSLK